MSALGLWLETRGLGKYAKGLAADCPLSVEDFLALDEKALKTFAKAKLKLDILSGKRLAKELKAHRTAAIGGAPVIAPSTTTAIGESVASTSMTPAPISGVPFKESAAFKRLESEVKTVEALEKLLSDGLENMDSVWTEAAAQLEKCVGVCGDLCQTLESSLLKQIVEVCSRKESILKKQKCVALEFGSKCAEASKKGSEAMAGALLGAVPPQTVELMATEAAVALKLSASLDTAMQQSMTVLSCDVANPPTVGKVLCVDSSAIIPLQFAYDFDQDFDTAADRVEVWMQRTAKKGVGDWKRLCSTSIRKLVSNSRGAAKEYRKLQKSGAKTKTKKAKTKKRKRRLSDSSSEDSETSGSDSDDSDSSDEDSSSESESESSGSSADSGRRKKKRKKKKKQKQAAAVAPVMDSWAASFQTATGGQPTKMVWDEMLRMAPPGFGMGMGSMMAAPPTVAPKMKKKKKAKSKMKKKSSEDDENEELEETDAFAGVKSVEPVVSSSFVSASVVFSADGGGGVDEEEGAGEETKTKSKAAAKDLFSFGTSIKDEPSVASERSSDDVKDDSASSEESSSDASDSKRKKRKKKMKMKKKTRVDSGSDNLDFDEMFYLEACGLPQGETVQLRVRCVNDAGTGDWSELLSAETDEVQLKWHKTLLKLHGLKHYVKLSKRDTKANVIGYEPNYGTTLRATVAMDASTCKHFCWQFKLHCVGQGLNAGFMTGAEMFDLSSKRKIKKAQKKAGSQMPVFSRKRKKKMKKSAYGYGGGGGFGGAMGGPLDDPVFSQFAACNQVWCEIYPSMGGQMYVFHSGGEQMLTIPSGDVRDGDVMSFDANLKKATCDVYLNKQKLGTVVGAFPPGDEISPAIQAYNNGGGAAPIVEICPVSRDKLLKKKKKKRRKR